MSGIQSERGDGEGGDQKSGRTTVSMSPQVFRRFGRCRFGLRAFTWLGPTVFAVAAAGLVADQNPPQVQSPAPAHASTALARNSVPFDSFVDSAIQQERRVINLLRYYKPVVETYIQEDQPDSENRLSPKADDYFLSRLDLTGQVTVQKFSSAEGEGKKVAKSPQELTEEDFALALFPDKDHFDRQNYTFEFVRWEVLGEVRCAVIDIKPHENSGNRGLVARIWVEDQDFNIVRFSGSYTSKAFGKRPFHFDSWRLNTITMMWMPAYVYTEDSQGHDPASRAWLKSQTRIWGYDLEQAGDHREFAKALTDNPMWADPKRHEASQNLSPEYSLEKTTYTVDDEIVERLQVAGLMAPDGEVDSILQKVVNNLLITNRLDIPAVRCRVLLTTPLESFVVGRTIVVSRGLLDVLPDEAALAGVLAHELAHIILSHSLGAQYLSEFNLPFSDLEVFSKFNFRFDPAQEADADKKSLVLIANSPYKDTTSLALFLKAVELRSAQLPNLLRGRLSNDFASSHLAAIQGLANSAKRAQMYRTDQLAASPLGSRIKVDPWSDRIEMLKAAPAPPPSAAEKIPFEVSPFFPHLKRLEEKP
ncbi:MAG TPA: M48 family metalloprotease [Candidatus Sulfotelmatobacter sp.]|nr:M48 family metalloprotease [Candidatus Sulfotelmatobacter sp.]